MRRFDRNRVQVERAARDHLNLDFIAADLANDVTKVRNGRHDLQAIREGAAGEATRESDQERETTKEELLNTHQKFTAWACDPTKTVYWKVARMESEPASCSTKVSPKRRR